VSTHRIVSVSAITNHLTLGSWNENTVLDRWSWCVPEPQRNSTASAIFPVP
jgi:hypothetical protein